MKRIVILFAVVLLGCPPRPPVRVLPTDTASCDAACKHLQELHCPEGEPLENGTSCTMFCEETQSSGHALNPSCVIHIKKCAEVETICAR